MARNYRQVDFLALNDGKLSHEGKTSKHSTEIILGLLCCQYSLISLNIKECCVKYGFRKIKRVWKRAILANNEDTMKNRSKGLTSWKVFFNCHVHSSLFVVVVVVIIPPEQRSCWGVYWFHSVRLSVRPSVCPGCRVRSVTSTVLDGFFPY